MALAFRRALVPIQERGGMVNTAEEKYIIEDCWRHPEDCLFETLEPISERLLNSLDHAIAGYPLALMVVEAAQEFAKFGNQMEYNKLIDAVVAWEAE